ncbi:MAG: hypothetical protein V4510_06650 [bacterium]
MKPAACLVLLIASTLLAGCGKGSDTSGTRTGYVVAPHAVEQGDAGPPGDSSEQATADRPGSAGGDALGASAQAMSPLRD